MELRQLRYFVAAADLENFSAASERLNVAQSALSRQIANLEQEIGFALFARKGRRVHLTAEGRRFREEACDLLMRAERLKTQPGRGRRLDAGSVRIGAHHSFGYLFFPRLARRFNDEFPDLRISLTNGPQSTLEDGLLNDRLDLSVFSMPSTEHDEVSPDVALTPLCEESVCVIAGRGRLLPLGEECEIEQALRLPLIMMPPPHRERRTYEDLARRHGIRLNVVREADHLTMMKALLADGECFLILPRSAAFDPGGGQRWPCSRIRGLSMRRVIGTRKDAPPNDAVVETVRVLREEAAEMIRGGEIA